MSTSGTYLVTHNVKSTHSYRRHPSDVTAFCNGSCYPVTQHNNKEIEQLHLCQCAWSAVCLFVASPHCCFRQNQVPTDVIASTNLTFSYCLHVGHTTVHVINSKTVSTTWNTTDQQISSSMFKYSSPISNSRPITKYYRLDRLVHL